MLVVHEITTPAADAAKQARNAADLNRFLERLGDARIAALPKGDWIASPYRVPGNAHLPGKIPIYVGKLHTRTAEPRAALATPSPARGGPGVRAAAERARAPQTGGLRTPVWAAGNGAGRV